MAHETCTTQLTVVVDPGAEQLIIGHGDCGDLPDFGHVQVELWGADLDMPQVGGDYYSDPFWDTWEGWFLSDEELWAVSEGKAPWDEYRVKWEAQMEAWYEGPLGSAGAGR